MVTVTAYVSACVVSTTVLARAHQCIHILVFLHVYASASLCLWARACASEGMGLLVGGNDWVQKCVCGVCVHSLAVHIHMDPSYIICPPPYHSVAL